jgi:lysophospholipase L1-like esterase
MNLPAGDTLLFIGDSITDCGRARPVGQGDGLGSGYVALVDSLIRVRHPDLKPRILNTGVGGNRVIDIEQRWDTDVVELQPDWLVVMIGINDVWRRFDSPLSPGQVTAGLFRETYQRILSRRPPGLKGTTLMTPYFIEPDRNDAMRAMMDQYTGIVRELAEEHGATFVDVQAAFDAYLVSNHSQSLSGDRVHPCLTGHMVIARSFLDSVGFEWD